MKVSKSTTRRLGLAPDKKRKSSVYYRGALNAKPATILNNKVLGQEHKNSHHCACNVKMVMEFGSRWQTYVNTISCDDKCKLHIGNTNIQQT